MNISYINGFLGGALIGLAAVLFFWFNGRIMGVSGIVSKLLTERGQETAWRLAFVVGLIVGGWGLGQIFHITIALQASWPILLVAGLLVGYGTVKANGCTSGHGVCGVARLSKRSIVATFCFISAGIITVYLRKLMGF